MTQTKGGKHRTHKVKLKHRTIPGLREALEVLAAMPCVSLVVPGEIKRVSGGGRPLRLHVSADTPTGVKIMARSGSAVQEVFIVTNDRDELKKKLSNADDKEPVLGPTMDIER
jgi:hypothetical protein